MHSENQSDSLSDPFPWPPQVHRLSCNVQRIVAALVATFALTADIILSVRTGDAKFLIAEVYFVSPFLLSFLAGSSSLGIPLALLGRGARSTRGARQGGSSAGAPLKKLASCMLRPHGGRRHGAPSASAARMKPPPPLATLVEIGAVLGQRYAEESKHAEGDAELKFLVQARFSSGPHSNDTWCVCWMAMEEMSGADASRAQAAIVDYGKRVEALVGTITAHPRRRLVRS